MQLHPMSGLLLGSGPLGGGSPSDPAARTAQMGETVVLSATARAVALSGRSPGGRIEAGLLCGSGCDCCPQPLRRQNIAVRIPRSPVLSPGRHGPGGRGMPRSAAQRSAACRPGLSTGERGIRTAMYASSVPGAVPASILPPGDRPDSATALAVADRTTGADRSSGAAAWIGRAPGAATGDPQLPGSGLDHRARQSMKSDLRR
jgi:hypothetical protein